MSRLLYLAAIVAVVYLLLKSYRHSARTEEKPERAEDMVRCSYCGVHLPKSESVLDDAGKHYCSDAHRRAQQPPPDQNAG